MVLTFHTLTVYDKEYIWVILLWSDSALIFPCLHWFLKGKIYLMFIPAWCWNKGNYTSHTFFWFKQSFLMVIIWTNVNRRQDEVPVYHKLTFPSSLDPHSAGADQNIQRDFWPVISTCNSWRDFIGNYMKRRTSWILFQIFSHLSTTRRLDRFRL
jgi:hypothetical protein